MNNNLSEHDVMEAMRSIIADALRVPIEQVQPETNLIVDLDAESIDLVDIRFRMEEKFGFRASQDAFVKSVAGGDVLKIQENFTVANIVRYIVEQLAEAGAA